LDHMAAGVMCHVSALPSCGETDTHTVRSNADDVADMGVVDDVASTGTLCPAAVRGDKHKDGAVERGRLAVDRRVDLHQEVQRLARVQALQLLRRRLGSYGYCYLQPDCLLIVY